MPLSKEDILQDQIVTEVQWGALTKEQQSFIQQSYVIQKLLKTHKLTYAKFLTFNEDQVFQLEYGDRSLLRLIQQDFLSLDKALTLDDKQMELIRSQSYKLIFLIDQNNETAKRFVARGLDVAAESKEPKIIASIDQLLSGEYEFRKISYFLNSETYYMVLKRKLTLKAALTLQDDQYEFLSEENICALLKNENLTVEEALNPELVSKFGFRMYCSIIPDLIDKKILKKGQSILQLNHNHLIEINWCSQLQAKILKEELSLQQVLDFSKDQLAYWQAIEKEPIKKMLEEKMISDAELKQLTAGQHYLLQRRQAVIYIAKRYITWRDYLNLENSRREFLLSEFIFNMINFAGLTLAAAQQLDVQEFKDLAASTQYQYIERLAPLLHENILNFTEFFNLLRNNDNMAIELAWYPENMQRLLRREMTLAELTEQVHQRVYYLGDGGGVEVREEKIEEYNPAQSTHTASVHNSASKSALVLLKQYGSRIDDEKKLTVVLDEIQQWADVLPDNDDVKIKAVKKVITILKTSAYLDKRSNIKIRQLLALTWLAIKDDKSRISSFNDAEERWSEGLYDIQRGYNQDENFKDQGGLDRAICTGGTFNKLIQALVGVSPYVYMIYVTAKTVKIKLKRILKTEIHEFMQARCQSQTFAEAVAFAKLANDFIQNSVTTCWPFIKDKVTQSLFAEFADVIAAGDVDKALLDATLENAHYISLKYKTDYKRTFADSLGYRDYMSSTLFSPLALVRQEISVMTSAAKQSKLCC